MMKKIASLVLVCCLMFSTAALAQTATIETLDFGDFTLDMDPSTPGSVEEKTDGQIFIQAYPAYLPAGDESTNFNVVWTGSDSTDYGALTDAQQLLFISSVWTHAQNGFKDMGIEATDFETLDHGITEIGGRKALFFVSSMTIDYSGMGAQYQGLVRKIYQKAIVVNGPFGTYTFTASADSVEKIEAYVQPLWDTLRWN